MAATLKVEIQDLSDYKAKVEDRARTIPIIVFAHEGWKNGAMTCFQVLNDAIGDLKCVLPLVCINLNEPGNRLVRSRVERRVGKVPCAYLETKGKIRRSLF